MVGGRYVWPGVVNYIRQYQIDDGVPKAQAYNTTMYIMAGLLVIGFICNFMIKAVHARYHMTDNDGRRSRQPRLPLFPNPPARKEDASCKVQIRRVR